MYQKVSDASMVLKLAFIPHNSIISLIEFLLIKKRNYHLHIKGSVQPVPSVKFRCVLSSLYLDAV